MTIKVAAFSIMMLGLGWLGLLVGVTLISDAAPSVLVMFPSHDFLEKLPDSIALLSATSLSVTLTSDDADLAYRLYESGAWLVLPAGLQSCFSRL